MIGVMSLIGQQVVKWCSRNTLYRVRSLRYGDGSDGLVIEVFGPGPEQRSAVIRGDVGAVAPVGGWSWSSDAQRTEVVEALFDRSRWC